MEERIFVISEILRPEYKKQFRNRPFIPHTPLFDKYDMIAASELQLRKDMEKNPAYLQLVAYTIIINPLKQQIFLAQRISGDERLLNTYCLGFGGHVSAEDIHVEICSNPIDNAAIRELREELFIKKKNLNLKQLGYVRDLNSTTNEHIGIVYYLETGSVFVREKDKLKGLWVSYDDLKNIYYHKLESWSKYILDYIYESKYYQKTFNF